MIRILEYGANVNHSANVCNVPDSNSWLKGQGDCPDYTLIITDNTSCPSATCKPVGLKEVRRGCWIRIIKYIGTNICPDEACFTWQTLACIIKGTVTKVQNEWYIACSGSSFVDKLKSSGHTVQS